MKRSLGMMRGLALVLALALCAGCVGTAAAEDGLTLSEYVTYRSGYTTFNWTVNGNDPGKVRVYVQIIHNGTSEQSMWLVGETSGTSLTTDRCVPGKEYHVSLCDGEDYILCERDYLIPEAATFSDGSLKHNSVKVSIEKRSAPFNTYPEKYTVLKSFSASEMEAKLNSGTTWYGMKYQMKMPQLRKPRTFFVTVVFESPDGYLHTDVATDITFDRVSNGYQTVWWNLRGAEFFYYLLNKTGRIPTGTYRINLFWDGMWVNETTFDVSK